MANPTPVLSREELTKLKYEYFAGNYKNVSELATRNGMSVQSLHARIKRESWEEQRQELLLKSTKKLEKELVNDAQEWVDRVKKRSLKDWKIIDKSIDELGGVVETADGEVQIMTGIDPGAMRAYAAARKSLDDMARRSHGLVDPGVSVDITSRGQSIGESLVSAIAKIRLDKSMTVVTDSDVDRVLELEVVSDHDEIGGGGLQKG